MTALNNLRALAQAQHLAAKILAIRDKHAASKPEMGRYSVFMVTPRGYVHASTISAPTLACACQQFIKAWFSRTTTCAVVMRAPDGKRYRYAEALEVVEVSHV